MGPAPTKTSEEKSWSQGSVWICIHTVNGIQTPSGPTDWPELGQRPDENASSLKEEGI